MTKDTGLALVGLLIAAATLVWTSVEVVRSAPRSLSYESSDTMLEELGAKASRLSASVNALSARLDEIIARQQELVQAAADSQDPADRVDYTAELETLHTRLANLSALVSARIHEDPDAVPDTAADSAKRRRALIQSRLARDAVDRFRAHFLDTSRDAADRVEALRMLRRFPAELEPHDEQLITSALDLIDTETDLRSRERVVKELAHVRDERLMHAWIDILHDDTDEGIRAEAAEALGTFIHRPDIRDLLRQTFEHDDSERVRLDAGMALRRFDDDDPADAPTLESASR